MNLNQVTVPTHNVEASVAFYRLLGMKPIVLSKHYARFELPRGEATFSVMLAEGKIAQAEGVHVYFECDDVDSEVARLKAAGVSFHQEPADQPWLWREAWFKDISGNSLCLYHAGSNRKYPPWRLG